MIRVLTALAILWATQAFAETGEYLARAGDCVACHSSPGGKAFAGGLRMSTPIGVISATNITPDRETGIGSYTLEDFDRAVRQGVAPDGRHLYPAMPYPSYAKLTDADVKALYGYFMNEVPAVRQANRPSEIPDWMSARWPMRIWNLFFAPSTGFTPDRTKDAAWNRGAYLVEGLGHCGACHTPRSWSFAERALEADSDKFLAGANLDDWYAPSLRANKATGLGTWSKADIAEFLKTGHNQHASAFGSMIDVVNNSTPYLSDDDLNAMATFLASLPASEVETPWTNDPATASMLLSGKASSEGARVYANACQSCHRETGAAAPPYMPRLAGNPTVLDRDPASLINIVLNGAAPLVAKGKPDAYRMPQFREQLNNRQIAAVVSFIRAGWGNNAGPVAEADVAAQRQRTAPTSDRVVLLKMR